MPIYKDNILFPAAGFVDKDSEYRFIEKGNIIDALNCRWGFKNDGTVNAIENILGNKLLNITLPEGNNTIIGGCNFYEEESLITFLYNDKNKHCIFQIKKQEQTVIPILWEEQVLNFENKFVNRPIVIGGIIYWTDNNGPRNLIIEKAKKLTNNKYGEGIGYWIIEDTFVIT